MTPNRIDLLVDLTYGVVILSAVALILVVGTNVGVAFGVGALLSYAVHVVWKMARFDPEWMTREVTESVEETLTEEMSGEMENVEEAVTESVTAEVTEEVTESVTEEVGRTVSEELSDIVDQLERVNERVDRRPRPDQVDAVAPVGDDDASGGEAAGPDEGDPS